MDANTGSSADATRLERFAALVGKHGVEFIVIGGQAEALYGSPRVTYDVDLCYRRTPENIRRLAAALAELGPMRRGAPTGLPFTADAATIANGCNFTFSTPLGDLDLLGHVEPIGGYEEVDRRAVDFTSFGLPVRVIALDDLIRIKQHLRRVRDQDSLAQLLAIKRLSESDHRDTGRFGP